ncbi:MAG: pectate lyase [Pirellulales bacterium]
MQSLIRIQLFLTLIVFLASFAIAQLAGDRATKAKGTSAEVGDSEDLNSAVRRAMLQAVAFFHDHVAVHGGYVYCVSSDLKLQEGEGVTDGQTVWVQPPGTPAVGMALLEAFERTGEAKLLQAAEAAAHCLVRGQLASGGWQDRIYFDPTQRTKQAYRADPDHKKSAKNISTFDDDKTQSAVRFLAKFDRATRFKNAKVHEAVEFALKSILKNQFPNGGFGQVFEKPPIAEKYPIVPASYPSDWPRKHPGEDYWWYYTINDNNIARLIDTLLLASEIYNEPSYKDAAIRAADFLLLAQMTEPQPAWAQQYDFEMHPVWARKFEPPAISGSESQEVIRSLMRVYQATGQRKFLEPIPRALDYLQKSEIETGRLARFYELRTNRPLYMNRQYQLTYEPNDLPTHYGFIVTSNVTELRRRYEKLSNQSEAELAKNSQITSSAREARPNEKLVKDCISSLDERGAWVEQARLVYHKTEVAPVIKSETFIHNLDILSRFLAK